MKRSLKHEAPLFMQSEPFRSDIQYLKYVAFNVNRITPKVTCT